MSNAVIVNFSWPIRTGLQESTIETTTSNVLYDLSLYFEGRYKDKLGPVIHIDFDEEGKVRVFFPEGLLNVKVNVQGKRGRKPQNRATK